MRCDCCGREAVEAVTVDGLDVCHACYAAETDPNLMVDPSVHLVDAEAEADAWRTLEQSMVDDAEADLVMAEVLAADAAEAEAFGGLTI